MKFLLLCCELHPPPATGKGRKMHNLVKIQFSTRYLVSSYLFRLNFVALTSVLGSRDAWAAAEHHHLHSLSCLWRLLGTTVEVSKVTKLPLLMKDGENSLVVCPDHVQGCDHSRIGKILISVQQRCFKAVGVARGCFMCERAQRYCGLLLDTPFPTIQVIP